MHIDINPYTIENAKSVLSQYYYSDGMSEHYWYYIHEDEMTAERSEAVLVLLGTRKFVLSLRGNKYVLYYNGGIDVVKFTRNLSKDENGLHDFAEKTWYEYFEKKFYVTFSLDRYFYEEGISDMLDLIMRESYKQGKGTAIVLTMIYPQNLTMMEIHHR